MDIDEDDDFYAPEEPQDAPAQPMTTTTNAPEPTTASAPTAGTKTAPDEELEEGEEEDEGGEMDEDDDSVKTPLSFTFKPYELIFSCVTRMSTLSSIAKTAQMPLLHRTKTRLLLPILVFGLNLIHAPTLFVH